MTFQMTGDHNIFLSNCKKSLVKENLISFTSIQFPIKMFENEINKYHKNQLLTCILFLCILIYFNHFYIKQSHQQYLLLFNSKMSSFFSLSSISSSTAIQFQSDSYFWNTSLEPFSWNGPLHFQLNGSSEDNNFATFSAFYLPICINNWNKIHTWITV